MMAASQRCIVVLLEELTCSVWS